MRGWLVVAVAVAGCHKEPAGSASAPIKGLAKEIAPVLGTAARPRIEGGMVTTELVEPPPNSD